MSTTTGRRAAARRSLASRALLRWRHEFRHRASRPASAAGRLGRMFGSARRRRTPRRGPVRLLTRTLSRAFEDGIFGMSAQAGFWQTLSLPPLLLGLLGMVGFGARWLGTGVVTAVQEQILQLAEGIFSGSVVNQIIQPTVTSMLSSGKATIASTSFVISLWAGSAAMASFLDAISTAHRQQNVRHPVWQRLLALLLYCGGLLVAMVTLPLLAVGPQLLVRLLPSGWEQATLALIRWSYYPALGLILVAALSLLYLLALPRKLPLHRLLGGAVLAVALFFLASYLLRIYLRVIAATGYTYGALATPIAYLLFAFMIAFAIVLGAQFNSAVQEMWPAQPTAGRDKPARRAARRLRERGAWQPREPE